MATKIETARQMVYTTAWRFQNGEYPVREITMAKLYAARIAVEVADECIQIHGGNGYMKEYGIERSWRDLRLNRIGAGSDEIMLEVIGALVRAVETLPTPADDCIIPVMRSSVTIRDVARLAEVHPGTVSRARTMRTRGLVNPETARQRVIRAAEELGYRPQSNRTRAEDQPLVHGRRTDPGSDQPAVSADHARDRGPAR